MFWTNTDNPWITYIGIYLQDTIFINDENKDKIDDLINFDKFFRFHQTMQQVQSFKK